jgi:hypothetical protein
LVPKRASYKFFLLFCCLVPCNNFYSTYNQIAIIIYNEDDDDNDDDNNNNNNNDHNNGDANLQDTILLLKIYMGTRKNFSENTDNLGTLSQKGPPDDT